MNISKTNEYFFPILSSCIYYNPPMNHVKFRQDQIKMADLSPFLFAQIDKIFENVVPLDEYLQHQLTFLSDTIHVH